MPAPALFTAPVDLQRNALLVNALLHPVGVDPTTPTVGQVWYRTDTDRLMIETDAGSKILAVLDDVTSGAINGSLWEAQSVVTVLVDDEPQAQVLAEGTVLGRAAGGDIGALTAAQLRTILGVEAGATADQTGAEILALLLGVDGAGSGLDADTVDGQSAADIANSAVATITDSAPDLLNTLNELAAALGDDPNFAATMAAALAARPTVYTATVGDGSTEAFDLTHNLGTKNLTWSIRDTGTDEYVAAWPVALTLNSTRFAFSRIAAAGQYDITLMGRAD